jgi:hypothetical protein
MPAPQLPLHAICPALPSNLPGGHASHASRVPIAFAKRPAGHGAQAVPPLAYWPAGQVIATAVHEVAVISG